jgi:hypothetical protein
LHQLLHQLERADHQQAAGVVAFARQLLGDHATLELIQQIVDVALNVGTFQE